jgi:hypothetical protein
MANSGPSGGQFLPRPEILGPLHGREFPTENDLLPYMALGWTTEWTHSHGNLCGVYALVQAIRNVQVLHDPDIKEWDLEDVGTILADIRSPEFMGELVTDLNTMAIFNNWPEDVRHERLLQFSDDNFYDRDQLLHIVKRINRRRNTEYRVGIIRGPSTANGAFALEDPGVADPDLLGPVVWVHHSILTTHWESFGPRSTADDIKQVHSWGLEDHIEQLFRRPIYRAIKNFPGDPNKRQLKLTKGQWLFGQTIPANVPPPPAGRTWVTNSKGPNRPLFHIEGKTKLMEVTTSEGFVDLAHVTQLRGPRPVGLGQASRWRRDPSLPIMFLAKEPWKKEGAFENKLKYEDNTLVLYVNRSVLQKGTKWVRSQDGAEGEVKVGNLIIQKQPFGLTEIVVPSVTEFAKISVYELDHRLTQENLSTKGRKAEKVERLRNHLDSKKADSVPAHIYYLPDESHVPKRLRGTFIRLLDEGPLERWNEYLGWLLDGRQIQIQGRWAEKSSNWGIRIPKVLKVKDSPNKSPAGPSRKRKTDDASLEDERSAKRPKPGPSEGSKAKAPTLKLRPPKENPKTPKPEPSDWGNPKAATFKLTLPKENFNAPKTLKTPKPEQPAKKSPKISRPGPPDAEDQHGFSAPIMYIYDDMDPSVPEFHLQQHKEKLVLLVNEKEYKEDTRWCRRIDGLEGFAGSYRLNPIPRPFGMDKIVPPKPTQALQWNKESLTDESLARGLPVELPALELVRQIQHHDDSKRVKSKPAKFFKVEKPDPGTPRIIEKPPQEIWDTLVRLELKDGEAVIPHLEYDGFDVKDNLFKVRGSWLSPEQRNWGIRLPIGPEDKEGKKPKDPPKKTSALNGPPGGKSSSPKKFPPTSKLTKEQQEKLPKVDISPSCPFHPSPGEGEKDKEEPFEPQILKESIHEKKSKNEAGIRPETPKKSSPNKTPKKEYSPEDSESDDVEYLDPVTPPKKTPSPPKGPKTPKTPSSPPTKSLGKRSRRNTKKTDPVPQPRETPPSPSKGFKPINSPSYPGRLAHPPGETALTRVLKGMTEAKAVVRRQKLRKLDKYLEIIEIEYLEDVISLLIPDFEPGTAGRNELTRALLHYWGTRGDADWEPDYTFRKGEVDKRFSGKKSAGKYQLLRSVLKKDGIYNIGKKDLLLNRHMLRQLLAGTKPEDKKKSRSTWDETPTKARKPGTGVLTKEVDEDEEDEEDEETPSKKDIAKTPPLLRKLLSESITKPGARLTEEVDEDEEDEDEDEDDEEETPSKKKTAAKTPLKRKMLSEEDEKEDAPKKKKPRSTKKAKTPKTPKT